MKSKGKVVSQNDLAGIIISNAEAVNVLLSSVDKLAKACAELSVVDSSKVNKSMSVIKNTLQNVIEIESLIVDHNKKIKSDPEKIINSVRSYEKMITGIAKPLQGIADGVNNIVDKFTFINNIINTNIKLSDFIVIGIKLKILEFSLINIVKTIKNIIQKNDLTAKQLLTISVNLLLISNVIDQIINITILIKNKYGSVLLGITMIKSFKTFTNILLKTIHKITALFAKKAHVINASNLISINIILLLIKPIFKTLQDIIDIIVNSKASVKMLVFGRLYLRGIRRIVNSLSRLIISLIPLSIIPVNWIGLNLNLIGLRLALFELNIICKIISRTRAGIFMQLHILNIITTLKLIRTVVRQLSRIRPKRNLLARLTTLIVIFTKLAALSAIILLSSPVVILASIAMIAIVPAVTILFAGIGLITLLSRLFLRPVQLLSLTISMILLSTALIAMTATMLTLTALSIVCSKLNWKSLLTSLAMIGAVIIAVGALALLVTLIGGVLLLSVPFIIILGAVTTLLIGTVIIFVGGILLTTILLNKIAEIDLDQSSITDSVRNILSVMMGVVKEITSGAFKPGSFIAANIRMVMLNSLAKKLVRLAKNLNKLSEIEINRGGVIGKLSLIMEVVFGRDNSIYSILSKSGDVQANKKLYKKTKRLLKNIINTTNKIKRIVKNLNEISDIKLDGDNIRSNIEHIFNVVDLIDNKLTEGLITNQDNNSARAKNKALRKANKNSKNEIVAVDRVGDIISEISDVVKDINNINKFKVDHTKTLTAVEQIFESVNKITNYIDTNEALNSKTDPKSLRQKLNIIKSVSDATKSLIIDNNDVNGYKQFVDNSILFMDKINDIDIEKLKATETVFSRIAEFSKTINGNFDKLADAMNERIAPLLEELKEQLNNVGQKVEKSGADISASTYAASRPSLSRKEMIKQVGRENNNDTTGSSIEEMADKRMEEQMRNMDNNLSSKIDELIDLFKNGLAQVKLT